MADTEIWTPAQYHTYLAGGTSPPLAPPVLPSAAEFPPDRYRSKTERRYAQEILEVGQVAGVITAWWYEPCKGLYLAPKTSYSPDFLVQHGDGRPLEFHEIKGEFIRPQDWQKTKQAAALYPCFRFVLAQWKAQQWHWKVVPAL